MAPSTSDFEKLGVFYLGRRFDADAKKPTDDLVLYDSKDLVTHALCVGMTGSGKTGLGVAVIEEAAIEQGIPRALALGRPALAWELAGTLLAMLGFAVLYLTAARLLVAKQEC